MWLLSVSCYQLAGCSSQRRAAPLPARSDLPAPVIFSLPPHAQRGRAAQHHRSLPLPRRALAVEVGKAPQQGRDRDLRLDARQRGAEAEVGAVAERRGDGCRARPMSRRSGSAKRAGSRLAAPSSSATTPPCGPGWPAISQSTRGDAIGGLHRAVVAQELLDGRADQRRIVLQAAALAPGGAAARARHWRSGWWSSRGRRRG